MGFLAGKRILITGLLSNRSIAYGIAKACHREGAQTGLHLPERALQGARSPSSPTNSAAIWSFPATSPTMRRSTRCSTNSARTGKVSTAWCIRSPSRPSEAIEGDFLDGISREAFRIAHDVSSYSYPALAKAARPLLLKGNNPALLALAYLGAERTMPNYNTMGLAKASLEAATRYLAFCLGPQGIRANAISAGPIKTLAASGIGNFGKLLAYNAHHAPLRRNVTIEEVGNAAAFMLSDLASGITGEIMYVDGGLNTTALGNAEPLPT